MNNKFINNLIIIAVCFVLFSLAITLFMWSDINYKTVSKRIINFDKENIDSLYLKLYDKYGQSNHKSLSEFFNEDDSLKRLQFFNSVLNKEFNYIEFDTQSLMIKDSFNYKKEFRIDYGREDFGYNDDIGISLKSIQIGENTCNVFNFKDCISTGTVFESNDFFYDNIKSVPIILGNEYENMIKIGDTFKFEYLFKQISLKVIGFLKKDTMIILNNNIYNLDKYIIMPLVNTIYDPTNETDIFFQKILYSQKNWGLIKINSGDDFLYYKNRIDQISKQIDLKYELSEGYVHQYIVNISNTINSTKGLFLVTAILLFVVLSLIYTFIHIWKYNKMKRNYAIHLICGCCIIKLKFRLFLEMFCEILSALIVSIFIIMNVFNYYNLYAYDKKIIESTILTSILLSSAMMFIVCIIINRFIKKSDIYFSINKEI